MVFLNEINRWVFDSASGKKNAFLRVMIAGACWYGIVIVISMGMDALGFSRSDQFSGEFASLYFAISFLILPVFENLVCIFIFLMLSHFIKSRVSVNFICLIVAVIFVWLHSPNYGRMLSAFGIFFIVSMVYSRWRETDPSFAYWSGLVVHVLFNSPVALYLIFLRRMVV